MEILKINEWVAEKRVASFKQKISISVDIDTTKHSVERQFRHVDQGGEVIELEEIVKLMRRSAKDLIEKLTFDELNVGDSVVLFDSKTNLNVVCNIKGEKPKLDLVAVTVMRKKNFKPYSGQLKLTY